MPNDLSDPKVVWSLTNCPTELSLEWVPDSIHVVLHHTIHHEAVYITSRLTHGFLTGEVLPRQ